MEAVDDCLTADTFNLTNFGNRSLLPDCEEESAAFFFVEVLTEFLNKLEVVGRLLVIGQEIRLGDRTRKPRDQPSVASLDIYWNQVPLVVPTITEIGNIEIIVAL